MKYAHVILIGALFAAAPAAGQESKLVLQPGHGAVIQQYVVTEKVKPVVVSIPIELGTEIPEGIALQPVPLGLVAKVPEVRNYEYMAVGNKIIFVEPYTRRVVQIVQ